MSFPFSVGVSFPTEIFNTVKASFALMILSSLISPNVYSTVEAVSEGVGEFEGLEEVCEGNIEELSGRDDIVEEFSEGLDEIDEVVAEEGEGAVDELEGRDEEGTNGSPVTNVDNPCMSAVSIFPSLL